MTTDPTELTRRVMVESGQTYIDLAVELGINGDVWDTGALQKDFEVLSFFAPFVVVRRRADGSRGTLEFTHSPRIYFNWQAD